MRTLVDWKTVGALIITLCCATPVYVSGQATRPSPSRSADEWVTTQIQAKYFIEPDIKSRDIVVRTLNGIVTLRGEVKSREERQRAVEIAARVNGVKNVVDDLMTTGESQATGTSGTLPQTPTARPPAAGAVERVTQSDPVILTEIKTRFAVDPEVSAFGVSVSVEQGIVTLAGDVNDGSIRARAERLARAVSGVQAVRNELKIKG